MNLVIGASGLIGSHLIGKFQPCTGSYFSNPQPDLIPLDITSYEETEKILHRLKPKNIFIPAAIPEVDHCETHEKETEKTNIHGLKNVLAAAKEFNPKIIYLSSEYVFDGKNGPYSEDDTPHPINIYGKQKLLAETLVQKRSNHIIVRTVWVYGKEDRRKNFMYAVIDRTKKKEKILVPLDEISNPTSAIDLANALQKLVQKNYVGIINVVGSERMSKFDFAKKIVELFDLPPHHLVPVESDSIPRAAKRPKNAGLKTDLLNSLGISMRSLEDNLQELKNNGV